MNDLQAALAMRPWIHGDTKLRLLTSFRYMVPASCLPCAEAVCTSLNNRTEGNNMKKLCQSLLTTLIAASISGFALAAPPANAPAAGSSGPGQMMGGERHHSQEERQEHFQRRQAVLHDKLKLNASQEAAWKTYIAAVAPTAAQQPPQRPQRGEWEKLSAPERMEKMLAMMKEREAVMSRHLEATKTFYATLSPLQKQIFDDNVARGPMLREHGHHR
jgi:hypothetical protein